MKKHKFLKTLLASLMALTVISTSAVPAIAEEAEAETEAEVVDVVEETSEEEGEEIVIDVPEEEEDEGGSEIIVDIPVDEGGEETGGIGVVNFDDNADDVTVTAEAPEGAFPEGTEMTAVTVDDQVVLDLIQETAGEDAEILAAIDITFTNDGDAVQPDEAVKVAFAAAGLTYTEDLRIVHVHEDEEQNLTATVLEPEAVTETEDGGIAFDADSFSVYAVVGHGDTSRLTVKFMNGTTEIASTVVKKTDITATTESGGSLFDQIVYDPGAGTLGNGQVFRGWTTNANYTDADVATGKNIDTVREEVKAMLNAGVDDGASVTYYAMIYNVFNVIYRDEAGAVIKNDSVLTRESSADYQINEQYTPKTSDQEFQGWHITPETINNATLSDGTPVNATDTYANLTNLKLSGSIILTVVAPQGFWLIFKENGSNVSYTAPRFLEGTEVTSDPGNPTRLGYIFEGWFENADGTGSAFTFGNTLSKTTTLYAKWTPVATANYTVLIWKQNLAGDGYDFVESVIKSGATGSTPTAVTVTTGRVDGATYNGETGFHFKETDQASKKIAPEGNTIVNVYWDRNEHTLTFQAQEYTYTQSNSTSDGYYYIPLASGGYEQVYLDYHNQGRYWSIYYSSQYANGSTYNGLKYTRSNSATWTTIKTITALYGQSIGDNFPIVGSNGVTYDNGERWSPQNSSTYNQVLIYIDIMPNEDVTFRLNTATHDTKNIYYYIEALPGETGETVTYNGKTFVLHKHMPANYGFFTEAEDYLNFVGFTKFGYTPSNAWGSGGASTVYCYYTRNVYPINFMDGGYFDGDGNPIDEDNRGQLKVVNNIPYVSDLASYNEGGDDYYEPTATSGYVFSGWFIDSACNQPYTFTTMPEGGVTVYAKWVQVQYRVFLHPDPEGTLDPSLSMGGQATSFRVDAGERIADGNAIDARRDDYELVGWYTDAAYTHQFNFEAYALNDSNTNDYDKQNRSTETDQWGNPTEATNKDVNRPWITKCLDLYAKWRSKLLGADGITVVYEAGAGTFSNGGTDYTDPLLYKDLAKSTATTATTPTDTTKFEFSHWVVQKWNGSEFEPTNETVLPGDTFEVRKAYAQVTENPGSTSENPSYTYTVKLCAEYKAIEAETKTHIYWYANNGTTAKVEDNDLSMNQPVNIEPANRFSYAGYVFIGWSRWSVNTKPSSPTDTTNLWLVYDAANNKFTCDGVDVTQVACDEASPYHDLYAVWQHVGEYHVRFSSHPEDVYNYTMPRDAETTVNLLVDLEGKELLATNYLYGGYYNYAEFNFGENPVAYTAKKGADDAATNFQKTYWAGKTAFTTMPANAMKPTAGATYYIKEVPDYYLQPFNQYYFKENYGNFLTRMYAMTAIDDGRYSELGFASLNKDYAADTAYNYNYAGVISSNVIANTLANVYATVKFETASKKNPTQIRAAADLTAVSDALGYVGAVDITSISHDKESDLFYNVDKSFNGVCFNFVPYYVTLDGVTVYGKIRKANCGTGYVSTFVPTDSVITSGEISALTKGN